MELQQFIEPVVTLAIGAGDAILEVYATEFGVQEKADASPLTLADLASHRQILQGLRALTPDLPILSEESGLPDYRERARWGTYWLVDPLDGTKEFVSRNGEFTVNIALVAEHRPVLGVVHVPAQHCTYLGCAGHGAERRARGADPQSIHVSARAARPVRVVGSRSHRASSLDRFLDALGEYQLRPVGSALKFCLVAEGAADIYPRLGPTSEWDTAAAQAVVEQAGGSVVTLDGKPLSYNGKPDILNPHFLVMGPKDRDWLGILQQSG